MEHVGFLALKPISLPRSTSLAFSPSSPFSRHHHGASEARRGTTLPFPPPRTTTGRRRLTSRRAFALDCSEAASDARGLPACCPGLMQPLRISNSCSRSQSQTVTSTMSGQNGGFDYTASDMLGHSDKMEDIHSSVQDLSCFSDTPFFYDGHGGPSEKVVHNTCHGLHAVSRMISRTYRSKDFAIGGTISSQIKYIVEETMKLYRKEKKLMKILTYQQMQQNAKSTEMNEHVHSYFLPNLRKLSASNHGGSSDCCNTTTLQGCVWGAPFGVSSHYRLAKHPSALGENSNGAVEDDKSESQDKMVFSFWERVKSNGILIGILILALICGTKDRISRMMKAAGLDSRHSVILLYSCICVVKSVYGTLKEAKDVAELIMFYMNVSKKESKSREK